LFNSIYFFTLKTKEQEKYKKSGRERAREKKNERHCSVHKQRTGRRSREEEKRYIAWTSHQAHLHGMKMFTETDQ